MKKERNIAIAWDFDRTLTPQDSTSELIDKYFQIPQQKFWEGIHNINQSQSKITWKDS